MSTNFKDRVAIITGSSRGIGREIALELANRGCHVVITAKTTEPHPKLPGTIFTVAEEVNAIGKGKALPIKCDIRNVSEIQNMVNQTLEHFGKVDILINNAGALWWQPILQTPEKRFDLVMDVNVKGSFFAAQAVLPSMIENKWGHIINMSPPFSKDYIPNHIAYMVSKFGMTMLTFGLAEESKEHNIAVNSLWPQTMVESLATKNWGLGDESLWRKASILVDSTMAILEQAPPSLTGQALLDEPFLRSLGVADFDKYNCVPGSNPPPLSQFLTVQT